MIKTDVLIIGSGVVGLAIARELSSLGMDIILAEKEKRSGEGISSRNSGVIHAGMYYPTNSLKAKFCTAGSNLLFNYCLNKDVQHKRLGKLIVANNKDENIRLSKIYQQGLDNGVELNMLSKEEVQELEPEVECYSAISSPNTGIIDVPELILALEGDIQKNNGFISYRTKFLGAKKKGNYFEIKLNSGEDTHIESPILINCGGLFSDVIASSIKDLKPQYIKKVYFWKGHYFKYSGKSPFKQLVYPLSTPGSLGIHFTIDMSGQAKFGPDLVKVDSINYKFEKNLKNKFFEAVKSYWPEIDKNRLQPDYCGIRPKIYKENSAEADFYISIPSDHGVKGLYNLQGIESPGLTCSLAISEYLSKLISREVS